MRNARLISLALGLSSVVAFAQPKPGTLGPAQPGQAPPLTTVPTVKPPATSPTPTAVVVPKPVPITTLGLSGWVDLHAHPMSYLGFGGKLIAGGVDVGSWLPADASCNHHVTANSMQQALGNDNAIHGGWGAFDNQCGDSLRNQVIHSVEDANHALHTRDGAHGASDFNEWPAWNDILHQKMWVEFIRRAWQGGQRVMVALAVNNKTLGDAVAGPGDLPTDDRSAADLQTQRMKEFVGRHTDFMQIAYTPAELENIVRQNKLAIVLGMEVDDIGNFNKVPATNGIVAAEITRLYNQGIRYIFPIHVIDNPFGGTAIYEGGFNASNYREAGHFWNIECAAPGDGITYHYVPDGFDLAVAAAKQVKLGIDGFRNPPTPPPCPGTGHQNVLGLTPLGEFAVKEMMRHGMIVDIDHMSQKSANRVLDIAEAVGNGGYPLVSGHNGMRGHGGNTENQRTVRQLQRIHGLHGMFGLGSAANTAWNWIQLYGTASAVMSTHGATAFGTDLNGMVKGPSPRPGSNVVYDASFPMSSLGSKSWNYNRDGVAHYGMLADFIKDIRASNGGNGWVDTWLMSSADYFWHMWEKCEQQKVNVH
jgi:microsomal dipeptidase-like Zn-dependent dipeptidase